MLAELRAQLPELDPIGVAAGLHVFCWLPPGIPEAEVVELAAADGLIVFGRRRITSPAAAPTASSSATASSTTRGSETASGCCERRSRGPDCSDHDSARPPPPSRRTHPPGSRPRHLPLVARSERDHHHRAGRRHPDPDPHRRRHGAGRGRDRPVHRAAAVPARGASWAPPCSPASRWSGSCCATASSTRRRLGMWCSARRCWSPSRSSRPSPSSPTEPSCWPSSRWCPPRCCWCWRICRAYAPRTRAPRGSASSAPSPGSRCCSTRTPSAGRARIPGSGCRCSASRRRSRRSGRTTGSPGRRSRAARSCGSSTGRTCIRCWCSAS